MKILANLLFRVGLQLSVYEGVKGDPFIGIRQGIPAIYIFLSLLLTFFLFLLKSDANNGIIYICWFYLA